MIIYQYPRLLTDMYATDYIFYTTSLEYLIETVLTEYSSEVRYPYYTPSSFYRFIRIRFKLVEEPV